MTDQFFPAVAVGVAAVACITDLRSRRIPNVLTFGAAAAALLAHLLVGGLSAVPQAMLGWLVGAALFLPFFLLGGMGAGDVKLVAALGAWLGPEGTLPLVIYASIAGGVIALAVALGRGYLRTALRNVGGLLAYWWYVGPRRMDSMTLERSQSPRLAYAVPVLVGTLVTIWLG